MAHLGLSIITLAWNTVKMLKRAPVTTHPGLDRLIAYQFGILMPAPGQGHDKEPGLEYLTGVHIDNLRSFTEIDLGSFSGCKLQYRGDLRVGIARPRMKRRTDE